MKIEVLTVTTEILNIINNILEDDRIEFHTGDKYTLEKVDSSYAFVIKSLCKTVSDLVKEGSVEISYLVNRSNKVSIWYIRRKV